MKAGIWSLLFGVLAFIVTLVYGSIIPIPRPVEHHGTSYVTLQTNPVYVILIATAISLIVTLVTYIILRIVKSKR